MTREELLSRLKGFEWIDFECKEASHELPKSVWETVSAFSNTYGGWLVLGVKEIRKKGNTSYEIHGVEKPEKIENDFIGVLRSNGKFNQRISVQSEKFDIEAKIVLAFYIPMSESKPVYVNIPSNTYIRIGSGDQRATEFEIRAMQRDQAYGKKSNEVVFGTSSEDINTSSFQDYRSYLRAFNPELQYNSLNAGDFAVKTGIISNGLMTVGGLLMFGKLESILRYNPDFLIDYIEIPGSSITDAETRYTFRLQEQENIWEYYKIIFQRLRTRIDNPFSPRSDGFAPDDNSRLYCIRESLVNMAAHADYFSEIHSTVRVYDNTIQLQNAGAFPVNIDLVGKTIVSQPRNPNILRFFKLAKLSENGGYGIDKILHWKALTGCKVEITSDITKSEVVFELPTQPHKSIFNGANGTNSGFNEVNNGTKNTDFGTNGTKNDTKNTDFGTNGTKNSEIALSDLILNRINDDNTISIQALMSATQQSKRTINRIIAALKKAGKLERIGSPRNGKWVLKE